MSRLVWGRTTTGSVITIIAMLTLLSGFGCSRDAGTLSIHSEKELPAILLSEVLEAPRDQPFVQCPIEIENSSRSTRLVTLQATGCKCYGVYNANQMIAIDDSIEIPKQGQTVLTLKGDAPDSSGQKEYTARFSTTDSEGASRDLYYRCTVEVYKDLTLTPRLLSIQAPLTSTQTVQRDLQLVYLHRSPVQKNEVDLKIDWPNWVQESSRRFVAMNERKQNALYQTTVEFKIDVVINQETPRHPDPVAIPVQIVHRNNQSLIAEDLQILLIAPRVFLYPNRLLMGSIDAGESKQRRIVIRRMDDQPFTLKLVENTAPDSIRLQFDESTAGQHSVEIEVSEIATGAFSASVAFESDDSEDGRIVIAVQAHGISTTDGEK